MAGAALFGFSRLPYDDSLARLSADAHYASDILPFIMHDVARHGHDVRAANADRRPRRRGARLGHRLGVLNTMQQVGGALGLATLSTVAMRFTSDKVASLRRRPSPRPAASRPTRRRRGSCRR